MTVWLTVAARLDHAPSLDIDGKPSAEEDRLDIGMQEKMMVFERQKSAPNTLRSNPVWLQDGEPGGLHGDLFRLLSQLARRLPRDSAGVPGSGEPLPCGSSETAEQVSGRHSQVLVPGSPSQGDRHNQPRQLRSLPATGLTRSRAPTRCEPVSLSRRDGSTRRRTPP